jgi:hypothetical protein
LFTFHAKCGEIFPFAQAGKNGGCLFVQSFADLGVTGVFICNRSFWQLNNTEIAESAKTLLIFGNACRKIGRVQLSNTNQINILHGVPQNSM